MDVFSSYHPIVLILYFVSVIVLAMFTVHPVFLIASLLGAVCYLGILSSKRQFSKSIAFYILLFIMMTLLNPLFNNNGETALFVVFGSRVTMEAVMYGMAAAAMLVSVICWFNCYNEVITSDKFLYLFGKAVPGIAIALSMALRLVPLFARQTKKINKTQKTLGLYSPGSFRSNLSGSLRVFFALLTWSLENAVTTADSMKARGYGLKNRTSFSMFKFTKKDTVMLFIILCCTSVIIAGISLGAVNFKYYPTVSEVNNTPLAVIVYSLLLLLVFIPFITEVKESIRWKYLKSKI